MRAQWDVPDDHGGTASSAVWVAAEWHGSQNVTVGGDIGGRELLRKVLRFELGASTVWMPPHDAFQSVKVPPLCQLEAKIVERAR